MLLSILDHNLERVGFLDNEDNAKGLVFYNDMWSRYLETGSATFDFTVDKKNLDLDTHNRRVYQTLNERSFVSFHHNGRAYLFNIMKTVEDEDAITCYCENLNLELLNEYANPFKADQAYTFEDYCKKLDLLDFAALKLGINEVSDQKRTIEWTGQDTKLKRLISLANNFDAEIAFETYLNDDSSLKVFRLNVFKEHDDKHQGVGVRRDDIILNYDQNIEKITRTVDKTPIFNMIHPTGSDKTITRQVTKTRTVYKTVTVSGGGAGNTENALRNIESRKGQRVGTGQCYSLSALYSALLGGPGLGAGVTGISGRIGAGIAASNIGTDYRWGAFGWAVVGNEVSNAKAGAIVNIRANYGAPFWTGPYGHTAIIKSVSGSTITVLEQNYAGRMYVVENSYNLGAYMAGVQTVCFPPEIAAGKTVGGQAVTKQVPVQEKYTENVKETVKTVIPSNKYKEYKNDAGEVEFYVKDGSIYAPISAKLYPSVLSGKEIGDNWIRKDASIETTDENVLEANALKMLRAGCYPMITYDVKGDADLEPGDTVKVHDDQFYTVLLLEMRASEVHRSFSDPDQGHSVFTNFKILENQLPSDLLSRMEEMADAKAPYTIRLSSDNGTAFKNNEGETLFKADLYKGEKLVATDVSWRWALDGVVTVGMQYLVKAKDIDETAVLTVAGYVGNTEVATSQMTLVNLTERAETRRETFYKLTNSADVPEVPSEGGRNLYSLSKEIGCLGAKGGATNLALDTANGTLSFDVNGAHPYFGECVWAGIDYLRRYGQLIPIKANSAIAVSFTSADFNENYVSFVTNNKGAKTPKVFRTQKVIVDASELDGVKYIVVRGGINNGNGSLTGETVTTKIKVEYGNVATPYNQAPEDLGWSMATLVPTQQQRYLWKFEYIYYSDGSVEVTQPVNLSIAGADGTNGQTSHVHFAFADNATGGGFSLTTPKAYMGWYADFNESASNDPTKYKWTKVKGDQGAPGGKGDDGKTSYLHLAFASSADGRTGFSFTDTKQQYQGYYTDFTQSSSTDPTKYTWMDRRAGVEVGGVNLIKQSTAYTGLRLGLGGAPFQDQAHSLSDWIEVEPNTTYTLTTYEDVDEANMYYSLDWYSTNSADYSGWISRPTGAATAASLKGGKHYQTPANAKYAKVSYPTNYPKVKLERGNVATDYSLAPEDVQSDIDSKADQALTQQQLNALAEQNSIVKAEMEAKASIDTVNQWITAYQNYVNANDEAKAESERNLQEASARILQLKTDVGTLRQQWDFIDTYMTVQNEGLIIGKSDGSAYAKFANDRISLFSGSSEVMYISQGVLRIENGIFTKTIQIGRFRFETHPADQDMLVLRYLGG